MDDFKKRNTSGMNYLRDKMASASIKMGLSGGDIPDIDIAVMKGTNHDRVRGAGSAECTWATYKIEKGQVQP